MLIMRIIPGGGGGDGGAGPWKYYLLYLPSTGATYYSYGNLTDKQPTVMRPEINLSPGPLFSLLYVTN